MCITPTLLPNGEEVACRLCWQCRDNKVNDWVGRCIAESKTAKATHSITLTYGRDEDGNADHLRAKLLTYSDVQKYFKLLRKHGYPLRYFAVGEYGSMKARAHWHLVVYWQGPVPPHELNKRFEEPHWPHGTSFWELPNYGSIRYVCKYIQKDMGKDERQGHLAMSKKPPLGADYFERLADRYIVARIAPQTLEYTFDEARDRGGKKTRFVLTGKSADNFLRCFVGRWWETYGDHIPNSDLVEAWEDKQVPDDQELRLEPYQRAVHRPKADDLRWFMKSADVKFSDLHNAYYFEFAGGQGRWWWCLNQEGVAQWQDVLGGRATSSVPVNPSYRNASRGE